MSVGNQTQAIDFDRKDLTLVLGENLDQEMARVKPQSSMHSVMLFTVKH
jgi:hypothetical protein